MCFQERVSLRMRLLNRWEQYTKDKWANDEIAVIGSGASAYQVVPGMQPYAKKVHSFLRTPAWFFAYPDSFDGEERPQDYTCQWLFEPIATLTHLTVNLRGRYRRGEGPF